MKRKYNKKSFKTPEGYFEGFNEKLFSKLKEEGSSLPQKDGFAVPEDYFESLNKKVIKRAGKNPDAKVVQLKPYKKYYFAVASIAAIFLLVFGLQWFKEDDISFDSLANTDIENYLQDTDLGLSSYEIAEVVTLELEASDILENEINEENIIEYLDDNIDDLDELNFDKNE